MSTHTGHCHCGQTEWTATLNKDQEAHVLCHCMACQKMSASNYTLNQIIPKSALNITKGGDKLGKYVYHGDSGNAVDCFYCPNCTAHIYHHQHVLGPDTIILKSGLLDDASSLKPAAEIYGKDKVKWLPEVAQTFEVMPPQ